MRMVCSCVQTGNTTLPVSCVMYGWSIAILSTTISVIQRLRNAATKDSASIWLRCDKLSGSLRMESYVKESDQISPTWWDGQTQVAWWQTVLLNVCEVIDWVGVSDRVGLTWFPLMNLSSAKWRSKREGWALMVMLVFWQKRPFRSMAFLHEGAPCGMRTLRSDSLTMRVTGVRITAFCSAIVIDVIVHCHTAGAFWVKVQKTFVPIIVWLGFDPFRPVQNHKGRHVVSVIDRHLGNQCDHHGERVNSCSSRHGQAVGNQYDDNRTKPQASSPAPEAKAQVDSQTLWTSSSSRGASLAMRTAHPITRAHFLAHEYRAWKISLLRTIVIFCCHVTPAHWPWFSDLILLSHISDNAPSRPSRLDDHAEPDAHDHNSASGGIWPFGQHHSAHRLWAQLHPRDGHHDLRSNWWWPGESLSKCLRQSLSPRKQQPQVSSEHSANHVWIRWRMLVETRATWQCFQKQVVFLYHQDVINVCQDFIPHCLYRCW